MPIDEGQLQQRLEALRQVFAARGIELTWERVIGVSLTLHLKRTLADGGTVSTTWIMMEVEITTDLVGQLTTRMEHEIMKESGPTGFRALGEEEEDDDRRKR